MGFKVGPELSLLSLAETAGDAAPGNPEFIPNRQFRVEIHTFGKQPEGLFAAPFVKRVAEAGSKGIADEVIKDPLMFCRSTASRGARNQRAPHLTKQRHAPGFARAER